MNDAEEVEVVENVERVDATDAGSETSDQNKRFGKWLRDQLKSRGMTQVELARRIGKTYVHVRRVINGASGTKRATVVSIAYALNVPVIEAIRAAYGSNVEARESASWRRHYDDLPPEEKAEIDDYIEFRYQRWIAKIRQNAETME